MCKLIDYSSYAHAGLQAYGIACHKRLQGVHARQKQRIITGADNKHDSEGFSMNLYVDSIEPDRARFAREPANGKNLGSFQFQEAACFSQRNDFGGQAFPA